MAHFGDRSLWINCRIFAIGRSPDNRIIGSHKRAGFRRAQRKDVVKELLVVQQVRGKHVAAGFASCDGRDDGEPRVTRGERSTNRRGTNGYSQSVANQGWSAIPTRALKLMKGHSKGKRFRELGKSLPVPEQEALVRGALISNIQEGEDKAIQSIKALGEHSGPGNVPAGNTNRHRRTQPAAIGHRPQGGDSERARGAMKREVCVQSDQLHESTVTGQAKRQSEEEQEQLLDELIRRLRLTLASCESLAAVMRPICQLAHEWACGHQLSGGRRRRTKRMRNNETVVNGQVKLFGRPGGGLTGLVTRGSTRALSEAFIALPSLCPQ
jgi:hypothetical protein